MIQYLEACHQAEFFDKTGEEVKIQLSQTDLPPIDESVLPKDPPYSCIWRDTVDHTLCSQCEDNKSWWSYFKERVNYLLITSF